MLDYDLLHGLYSRLDSDHKNVLHSLSATRLSQPTG
jgi:hypothetical protein